MSAMKMRVPGAFASLLAHERHAELPRDRGDLDRAAALAGGTPRGAHLLATAFKRHGARREA